jgi:ribosomal protein S12 methylthiotransferase accessory factor
MITQSVADQTPLLSPPARVEVRALEPGVSIVTTPDGNHRRVSLASHVVLRLLDRWMHPSSQPELELELSAVEPLRQLLQKAGGLEWAPKPDAASLTNSPEGEVGTLLLTGTPLVVAALETACPGAGTAIWDPRAVVNRAYRTGELLVVAVSGPRDGDLIDLDRMCHDMRVPWVAVEITRGTAWIGPFVTPGVGASYEDAVNRRAAAAFDRRAHRCLRSPSLTGDCGPHPSTLTNLLKRTAQILGHHREGDLLHEVSETSHRKHPVLPMPASRTSHREHHTDDLVDDVTGVILRTRTIIHDVSVPQSLVTRQCDVADIRAVTPWANNILCQGSAFNNEVAATHAAIGESVERYCGNVLDTLPNVHGSYDELRRRGLPVLDPADLVLYSERQYAAPGFPFVPLTRQTRVHWVTGQSWSQDREILVPASLVYVNWYSAGHAAAPPTNFCAFAGIAAGPDLNFAVMSGLEEVIERHATMLWWLNAHPLAGVAVPPSLADLWAGAPTEHQRASLVALDNEFGVPVAAAVVHDDTDQLVNVGFSARHTFTDAATKAWTEALTLQEGSRDLLKMDGMHWAVMASGELNGRAFKNWRADRAYLDDFRPDMHDCDDLMVQQQVYLDPRAGHRMSTLLDPPVARNVADIGSLSERSASTYQSTVENVGHELIVVDLTTADVASTGLRVVRVIVPGTVGNAPAAFPFLGRRRVQDLPVELGWRERALDEKALNYFPMPHA